MTVSQGALLGLALSALLSLAAPFVCYFVARMRMAVPLRNVALGAVAFLLFALVLESLTHLYFLKLNPVTSHWLLGHAWGYALYGGGAAALYEETGRYLAMRFLIKPAGDPGTAVSYGIGHGGMEAVMAGTLAQVSALYMGVLLNLGRLDAMLAKKMPAAAIAQMHATYAHMTFATALLGGIERVCALLIQIALSLVVWRAVSKKQIGWYFLALALHFVIDFPAALTQRGVIPVLATEGYVWLAGVMLLGVFLIKLPPKQAALPQD
jgi:uncharacterized membrane protein YhfC